jgi:hypothetical protein
MKISQIFAQGGGHGHGGGCGCGNWVGDEKYHPTGYYYRRHGDYYCYNDGCGYKPHSHRFALLDGLLTILD